jgi:ABC-2 type transport system permease protein
MSSAGHILKKDFRVYFVSPIAYIVISIFLILSGWFFFSTFFLFNQAEMRNFFSLLPIIFSFVVPAVTMRLFAEELNTGSYELLLTMPVSVKDVVVGKFLSSVAFVAIMLVPTLSYAVFISFNGDLDWGAVLGGYLGAILLGAAFCSIGLFASSVTKNQIIAFIIGMSICFALTLIDKMLFFLPESLIGILQFLGADYHFQNFSRGIVDSRDILYFLSVCFVMIYATYLVIQEKK